MAASQVTAGDNTLELEAPRGLGPSGLPGQGR